MAVDELVPLAAVRERTRLRPWTVRRRLAAIGAAVYAAPDDRRRRLVRSADVYRIMQPVPVREGEDPTA